eukprot:TRINITY_DN36859_c0_g1_i1.p1 TRINITY_DN36859_c0_g1~~TRINITY_DN36859_c0_g1_i1.p1  ORF type:complete len:273 (+),score=68.55 TRINITY_DN36859_c0_g1_i1:54-872(+)
MVTVNTHKEEMLYYDSERSYIEYGRGTCPVILTAPHGGYFGFHDVDSRKVELPSTIVTPDAMTQELLDDTVAYLAKQGIHVYWVRAMIIRKYCDLNRPPAESYEGEEMAKYYREYHNTVEMFIDEMTTKYNKVPMMFDLHGQGYMLLCTIRGTKNGLSCEHHVEKHGEEFLIGEKSLLGCLEDQGVDIDPPLHVPLSSFPQEMKTFEGGYCTVRYSRVEHTDIVVTTPYTNKASVMQVETGSFQRKDRNVTRAFAATLGEAIAQHSVAYDLL